MVSVIGGRYGSHDENIDRVNSKLGSWKEVQGSKGFRLSQRKIENVEFTFSN